jgi:ABC-type branched-subunit amino acid transport system substrate-binding protein
VASGDTTGVTAGTITIGIHAPVTGAAPFPAASFSNGKAVYFNYINASGGIFGRKVNVVFEDDGYNPTQARAVCQKMVEQDHVFMLVGGGGADQIVACAQYAASVGVPYEAEGVATTPLSPLPNYYALSETYAQQGALLVQYIKNVLHKTKVAMVRADTANFDDGHTAFVSAAKGAGLQVVADLTIPKDANQGDAQSAATQICPAHPDVIYPLMAPTIWVNLAAAVHAQADCQQPTNPPRWAGVGITMGLNQVAQIVCATGAIPGGASFFSPFPELDAANAVDPAYQQAYQSQNHGTGDDIGFALWGAEKIIGAQLKQAGQNLTRQGFLAAIGGHSFATGVYPAVNYGNTHFGGSAVQVLLADCPKQAYVTQFQNKSGF